MKCFLKDILVDECKPRFNNYKKNGPPPCDYDARVAMEKVWLEEIPTGTLCRDTNATFFRTLSSRWNPLSSKTPMQFWQTCVLGRLEADSPPPVPPAAPITPEHKIKQEKFEQDYATFLLNSHAWSRSLGPNTTIELSPSQSDRAASSVPSQRLIPNPDMEASDEMDVASPSESHIFDFGDQVSDE